MLLLYRVEGRNESSDWETIRVCRPPYRKTETFMTERYGLLKMKKRRVVVNCVIDNEIEARSIAFVEAKKHMHKNKAGYQQVRISATHRTNDVLEIVVVGD